MKSLGTVALYAEQKFGSLTVRKSRAKVMSCRVYRPVTYSTRHRPTRRIARHQAITCLEYRVETTGFRRSNKVKLMRLPQGGSELDRDEQSFR